MINKDAVRKKKKIEVVHGQSTNASHNANDSENSIVSEKIAFAANLFEK